VSESYPSSNATPAAARRFSRLSLAAAFGPTVPLELLADAELLVSELVTNAIDAKATWVEVTVLVHETLVRLEVRDDAAGLPKPTSPEAGSRRGRGLLIVEELATAWGFDSEADRKCVWVEFAL
jgi:anti-sigma regulatory factor (Ser/Thr protein kinase)